MNRVLRRSTLCAALLAVAVSGAPGQERSLPPDFELRNFRWTGEIGKGGTVEVINRYGDIRSRSSDMGEFIVSASIQRVSADQEVVDVQIDELDGHARIEVVLPSGADPEAYPGRVDLTVLLPDGVFLRAEAVDGSIKVKKFRNDVEAVTVGGDMVIKTPGFVRARTRSGTIEAELSGSRWREPLEFESVSGDIRILLPYAASLDVDRLLRRVPVRDPGGAAVPARPARRGPARPAGAQRVRRRRNPARIPLIGPDLRRIPRKPATRSALCGV
jgi:hypothetical protein